jgi:hypothetical protein
MGNRAPFGYRPLWALAAAAGVGTTIVIACNSTTPPPGGGGATSCTTGKDTVSCDCGDGTSGTQLCGDPQSCTCGSSSSSSGGSSSGSSSGSAEDAGPPPGDGGHVDDGATPFALYAACAVKGSFGYPCDAAASGTDTTDCTDPNYPECFVGGQGSWCTALCGGDAAVCLAAAADAGATGLDGGGCIPTACNMQGYCK